MAEIIKAKKEAEPAILKCTCKHEFQDQAYGLNMRFHNGTRKGNGTVRRCTVCSKEQ